MNQDPRYVRSQKKLYEAIIELASESPLDKITITAIANRAKVHRSTVYEHADSSAKLLRQALHQELDELYSKYGLKGSVQISFAESCEVVLRYLESREAIFVRMNDNSGAEIRDILRSHFITSLQKMLDHHDMDFPETQVQISEESLKRFTVYAIAEMHVGMYAAALSMRKPRPAEILVEMIRITSPYWWRWE